VCERELKERGTHDQSMHDPRRVGAWQLAQGSTMGVCLLLLFFRTWVDGRSNRAAKRVPHHVVVPLEERLAPVSSEVLSGTVVEPRVCATGTREGAVVSARVPC
jgi:hypothetical protein